jgi:hypothetical protein
MEESIAFQWAHKGCILGGFCWSRRPGQCQRTLQRCSQSKRREGSPSKLPSQGRIPTTLPPILRKVVTTGNGFIGRKRGTVAPATPGTLRVCNFARCLGAGSPTPWSPVFLRRVAQELQLGGPTQSLGY